MRIELEPRDRRTLTIAATVFVLLVVTAVVLAPDVGTNRDVPTTYSAGSGGAKAAYLLLGEAGYDVKRWERPPADLPRRPERFVLILAEPTSAPGPADIRRVRDFVEAGGRVIAAGAQATAFFPDASFVTNDLGAARWKPVPAVSLSAITRAAPRITLGASSWWSPRADGTPLYADEGRTRVIETPMGKGVVVSWASATPLINAGLKEPGNVEFFLACVGEPADATVLWDEYFHGYRQSLTASAIRSPVGWLFLHLAVIAGAVLWTYSRRSGPVFVPAAESRLSPLEFVRTLGHLYERARAAPIALDVTATRFRYLLTRRLGLPPDAAPEAIEGALRERDGTVDPALRRTLEACESASGRQRLRPAGALRFVRALHRLASDLELFDRGAGVAGRHIETRRERWKR